MDMSRLAFPLEITEMVIDRLHDDKDTLSACSLVNKSWRARSQYHIYRILTLTVYGMGSLWKNSPETKIPSVPFPEKSALVEELYIKGVWHDATIACETLGCIVKCLPQLRVLNISSVHLSNVQNPLPGPLIPPDIFDVLPQLAELRSLSFSDVTCETHADPFNLASAGSLSNMDDRSFNRLEKLVCDNSSMAGRIYQLVNAVRSAHAHMLAEEDKPRGCGLRQIMLRLAPSPFHVNDEETLTFSTCSCLLQITGAKLEHLSLCLSDLNMGDIAVNRDMVGKYTLLRLPLPLLTDCMQR
ncbi:hypothetical protein PHLGIDRAFT_9833 [Phlebiopsis gigantea 11061_1 CR5-6]|uniref:F-box domain-containing protein n=1 Tax=Phlebiopsis gigantea (strain 11061_1 CR5-6) TaxID=745531 RepID=A0A0C3SFW0_PHLG1|nr:hypothetical protein PHLGIDRAFT_9833 [Phlebiopsis gigantea 11061_1 CR5-6]